MRTSVPGPRMAPAALPRVPAARECRRSFTLETCTSGFVWKESLFQLQALACLLASSAQLAFVAAWKLGHLTSHSAVEWVTFCLGFLIAAAGFPGGFSARTPPAWQRATHAMLILAASLPVAAYPWLFYGPDGLAICARKHESESREGWDMLQYYVNASTCYPLAAIAMACAATGHPPSRYSRSAVLCSILIWVLKLMRTNYAFMQWCGDPFQTDGYLEIVIQGIGRWSIELGAFWVIGLLVLRIHALEVAMEMKVSYMIAPLAGFKGVLHLAKTFGAITLKYDWPRASKPLAALDMVLVVVDAALLVLGTRAFTVPMRLLRDEATRVRGAPQAEAVWAASRMCRERAAVFCTMSTATLSQATEALTMLGVTCEFCDIGSSVDALTNAVSVAMLSGLLWQSIPQSLAKPPAPCTTPFSEARRASRASVDPEWALTVAELAGRGFSLARLLDFLELLLGGVVMPSFVARRSTTNDVVRLAVVPFSRVGSGGRAMATLWNRGESVLPQKMVTHCWNNIFLNLVAALVADGLGISTYEKIASQLLAPDGISTIRDRLRVRGSLDGTYWVCAFSVNQHAGICGGFGRIPDGTVQRAEWLHKRRDSVSRREYTACDCQEPKFFADQPARCEMNKFDDMMAFLARHVEGFSHVVAVDAEFQLFWRAWCVAELVEGSCTQIPKRLKLSSREALENHYDALAFMDVQECQASRLEDKAMILDKIEDVDTFNDHLQWVVFGVDGLFCKWKDARTSAANAGRIARRALRRAASRNTAASGTTSESGHSTPSRAGNVEQAHSHRSSFWEQMHRSPSGATETSWVTPATESTHSAL